MRVIRRLARLFAGLFTTLLVFMLTEVAVCAHEELTYPWTELAYRREVRLQLHVIVGVVALWLVIGVIIFARRERRGVE
jgi:hypothetical protein